MALLEYVKKRTGFRSQRGDHTTIIPARSLAGRALVLVIVIMTFLAGITAGAVHLIIDASSNWSHAIAREVTIQIRPVQGRLIEGDITTAAALARNVIGIETVKVISREEAEKLLEPWLGTGLDLQDLPVPRLIILQFASGVTPDLSGLKANLAQKLPNAGLDDHRLWLAKLSRIAESLVLIGLVILMLVLTATGLAVGFATRGAMAGTRHIIEVLHMVGAEDGFIAQEFQHHFLRLGLRGGLLGGGLAIGFFGLASLTSGSVSQTLSGEPIETLFGQFNLPLSGYLSVFLIGLVVSVITGIVSRLTVFRNLRGQD